MNEKLKSIIYTALMFLALVAFLVFMLYVPTWLFIILVCATVGIPIFLLFADMVHRDRTGERLF